MKSTGLAITALVLSLTTPVLPIPYFLLAAPAQTSSNSASQTDADRLLQQGIEQYQTSQFEAALQSWQQALTIYRELKDRPGEGASLGNLGNAYHFLGDYPKAIEYNQRYLEDV